MSKGMLFGYLILSSLGILGSEEDSKLSQPQLEACSDALLDAVRKGFNHKTFFANYPRCFDNSARLRSSVTAMASHRAHSEKDIQIGREILDLRNPNWKQTNEKYALGAWSVLWGAVAGAAASAAYFKKP